MKNQEPVLVLVPDLFFQAKIVATAKATGAAIQVFTSAAELIEASRTQPNSIVIVDLSPAGETDPIALIEAMRQDGGTGTLRFVGFYSHVNKDLERRARAAGCDFVLPKSVFSRQLPELLTGSLSIG
jgi:CheY-like chemotaxis protein